VNEEGDEFKVALIAEVESRREEEEMLTSMLEAATKE